MLVAYFYTFFRIPLWKFSEVQSGPSPGCSSEGPKNRRGQKPEGGATFLKYSVGCMQQPVGQAWNGGTPISNGGAGHHWPPRWRRPWMQCVYALVLFLAIFWGRVCIHSWNVNDIYYIVITPVEQSFHPVDYAWWQKQHGLLICSYCVSFTFAWGYCRLLFKHFCFYVQCLTVGGVLQPSSNVAREIEIRKSLKVILELFR